MQDDKFEYSLTLAPFRPQRSNTYKYEVQVSYCCCVSFHTDENLPIHICSTGVQMLLFELQFVYALPIWHIACCLCIYLQVRTEKKAQYFWRNVPRIQSCLIDSQSLPPAPMSNISVSELEFDKSGVLLLTLTWLPPTTANGLITEYEVRIGENLPDQEDRDGQVHTQRFPVSLHALTPIDHWNTCCIDVSISVLCCKCIIFHCYNNDRIFCNSFIYRPLWTLHPSTLLWMWMKAHIASTLW